ncbi:hypothetical protein I2F27_09285 [Acinetobacter sp. B5B]|nr:hypothetical protein [Acinetobacter baretiae]MBF7684819.1 hypothetical protein [Acinetobacter baretiae]
MVLLPKSLAMIFMVMPYLLSMISVLYIFLKQQKRAPTRQEMFRFAWVFNLLFWGFNLTGFLLSYMWQAWSHPEIDVWQFIQLYMLQPQILLVALFIVIMIGLPFYLVTLWFFGPQARRMAQHMFNL